MKQFTKEQIARLADVLEFTEDEEILEASYDEDTHDVEVIYMSAGLDDEPLVYTTAFPIDDAYSTELFNGIIGEHVQECDGKKLHEEYKFVEVGFGADEFEKVGEIFKGKGDVKGEDNGEELFDRIEFEYDPKAETVKITKIDEIFTKEEIAEIEADLLDNLKTNFPSELLKEDKDKDKGDEDKDGKLNYQELVEWQKKAIKDLKENDRLAGCYFKLDDTFAAVLAWEEGFDPEDKDLIHDSQDPEYALCLGVRYINPHDTCDAWDFPVEPKTGYLVCESSSLPSEDKIDDDFLLANAKMILADYQRAAENEDLINDESHLQDLEDEDRLKHLKDLYDMEPGDLTDAEIQELRDAGVLEEAKKGEADDLTKVRGTYAKLLNDHIKEIYDAYGNPSVDVNKMKEIVKGIIKDADETDAKKGFILKVDGQRNKLGLTELCTNAILRASKDTRLTGDRWEGEGRKKDEGILREDFDKEALEAAVKENEFNFSDEAVQAVYDVIDRLAEDPNQELGDVLWEVLDNAFIYYSDAFDYLKNCGETDFEEPVKQGFTGVCQIAYYFCEQEAWDLLNKIGL